MNKQNICQQHGRGVKAFVERHADNVTGVISGWDRVRLQGTLRTFYREETMSSYLRAAGVLWKDFKGHVCGLTQCIRDAASLAAEAAGRTVHYLRSSALNKEAFIEDIRRREHITEGLIAVLSVVEPCRTWFMRGSRADQKLHLQLDWGKCIHLYFYLIHPLLGLMHLRVQTWFPFLVHACINGREWLSRQMDAAGLSYTRADNCFTHISDVPGAQQLMDAQLETRLDTLLDPLIAQYHPCHKRLREVMPVDYYWTAAQSEHATDVMFKDRASLQGVYPSLIMGSMNTMGSEEVLRFLGRKQPGKSEVQTDCRRRVEGVRIKHRLDANTLKLYDKGPVLRSEVTINDARAIKVYRKAEGAPNGKKGWRTLRRSVADMPRRAQVSRAASERHLGALSAFACEEKLGGVLAAICRPVRRAGKRARALRAFESFDMQLLSTLNRAEFCLQGVRHRDLREAMKASLPPGLSARQHAGRIGRLLRLLRAHGLLAKVGGTQRYRVTQKARTIITCLLAAANASTPQLNALAT